MAKRAKQTSKAVAKAAADRAEARFKSQRAKASADRPAATAAPTDPNGKAIALITKGNLTALIKQTALYQEQASTAAGTMGDLIRDAAANKNLHRGAFADIKKLHRMGKKDANKLFMHLAHFDHMRKLLELDELAGAQANMFGSGVDGAEAGEVEDETGDNGGGDVVTHPRFGGGHPNHADGEQTDIEDAAKAARH